MPNYLYKCEHCKHVVDITLPLSYDPKKTVNSPGHKNVCFGVFKRIMRSPSTFTLKKARLGDWFKKQTGEELLGGD